MAYIEFLKFYDIGPNITPSSSDKKRVGEETRVKGNRFRQIKVVFDKNK